MFYFIRASSLNRNLAWEKKTAWFHSTRQSLKLNGKICKMLWHPQTSKKICYLSTYPPRKCGIAVFTKDLVKAMDRYGNCASSTVIAVNENKASHRYDERVKWQIRHNNEDDYVKAAEAVNSSDIDVVNIQHEFGIFGGEWGSHVLSFIKSLRKPVVTTLHTVQPDLELQGERVLKEILSRSNAIVVMNNIAVGILAQLGINFKKINVIPHGCPNIPFVSSDYVKPALDLRNRIVLCTFGLISRGKGIEYAIQALPPVVAKHPEVIYLIIGETHPMVKRIEGEKYRRMLLEQVRELGLEKHVNFQNRFLSRMELNRYLQATDIYLTPYLGKNQISSGTLMNALAAGRAVISTPYLHAKEVLKNGRGIICDFKNSASIVDALEVLLSNESLKMETETKAYEYSRSFIWPRVAEKYANLFNLISENKVEEYPIEVAPREA
jgi:glycosyltransferase involved in cell wall biosynthesis